jgi:lysophospholipase L1-like esterase
MTRTWLLAICLSVSVADASAAQTAYRVLFVGDSITANTQVRPDRTYPLLVGRQLRNVLVQNAGRPSATMSQIGAFGGFAAHPDLIRTLSGYFPIRVVVVLLGTNDWAFNVPLDVFMGDFLRWRHNVPPGPAVICVTPIWRTDEDRENANGDTLEDFREVIRRVCDRDRIVEGAAAIPHEAVYFFDGGLHPNARGNKRLAAAVAAALAPMVP